MSATWSRPGFFLRDLSVGAHAEWNMESSEGSKTHSKKKEKSVEKSESSDTHSKKKEKSESSDTHSKSKDKIEEKSVENSKGKDKIKEKEKSVVHFDSKFRKEHIGEIPKDRLQYLRSGDFQLPPKGKEAADYEKHQDQQLDLLNHFEKGDFSVVEREEKKRRNVPSMLFGLVLAPILF